MKKVLIVGATGNLGPHLVKALVDDGHDVSALLRPSSFNDPKKTKSLKDQGVHLIEGDLNDRSILQQVCKGKEVVISAVGGEQIMLQTSLAEAAKQAGVERFIPSEFGVDPHAAGSASCDLFDLKATAQSQIKETGVPTTMIYTNGFMEFWATGLGQLGPTSPPDQVQLFGDGDVRAYMTSLPDIARYVGLIIDDPITINREICMSNNPISQEEMIQLWESKSGKKVSRIPVTADEVDDIIESSQTPETMMQRIFTQLHRSVWIRGDSNKERDGVLKASDLYPQVKPISQADYFTYFL
ncbi:MAG: aromatic alcohol reductase [Saprospiraceae bacterium]|nr:aromatic alcohol reductase [Saprospiraceae bacterium]